MTYARTKDSVRTIIIKYYYLLVPLVLGIILVVFCRRVVHIAILYILHIMYTIKITLP